MVYDFGTEIAGYPQFTVNAKVGIQFEIGTSERLDTNKVALIRADTDSFRKIHNPKRHTNLAAIHLVGIPVFVPLKPMLKSRFRMFCAEFAHFAYEEESTFECSDKQLNEFCRLANIPCCSTQWTPTSILARTHPVHCRRFALHDGFGELLFLAKVRVF